MPAQAPRIYPAPAIQLGAIGRRIRERRKKLGVNAVTTAEAAGMSRVTLHRIEQGEPSVTMGAYLNALSVLGLELDIVDPAQAVPAALPDVIKLADYPQLNQLAWHVTGTDEVTPKDALGIYENNWRHIDTSALQVKERELINRLARELGGGRLLV